MVVVMLWMTLVPPAVFVVEDAIAGRPLSALLLRALPAFVAGVGLVGVNRVPAGDVRVFNFWVAIAVAVSLLASAVARLDSEAVPLRGRLLGPTLIYLLLPNTLGRQAGPAVLLSLGFVALRLMRTEALALLPFINDLLMVVVLNVAGVLFVKTRLDLERDLDQAWTGERTARLAAEQARADVRSLEGIIPICSHCRKLRSDGGDWQWLEQYVRDRTGAQFSHGICPACMVEHYPEFAPPRPASVGDHDA